MDARMIDVGAKTATTRVALASGRIRMGRAAFEAVRDGKLEKGDPLALGQAAGILAAKKTAETLPLCHPLGLDAVRVWFELDAKLPGVRAYCEARTTAKTGVEMEALCGVSTALLTVWDLVKMVDPALVVEQIRLERKEGGKSGVWLHPGSSADEKKLSSSVSNCSREQSNSARAEPVDKSTLNRAVVITVSDRCSRGQADDRSGPLLKDGLRKLGLKVSGPFIVPDEPSLITEAVLRAANVACLVALTGGTGLSPRDRTPETVAALCDRLIPGVGEALRRGAKIPTGALSRSLAGQIGPALVVCLPGSTGGVRDGLEVLAELLPHALHIAGGGDHQ